MKSICVIIQYRLRAILCGLVALSASLLMTGCDDSRDHGYFDYDPPSGYGALILDNQSPTDINLYVDGLYVGKVGNYSDKHYDFRPGSHRVVLDEHDGGRRWSGDIDILDGRLTIIKARFDFNHSRDYWVDVDLD